MDISLRVASQSGGDNSNLTLGGSSTYSNSVFFFGSNLLFRHPFAVSCSLWDEIT